MDELSGVRDAVPLARTRKAAPDPDPRSPCCSKLNFITPRGARESDSLRSDDCLASRCMTGWRCRTIELAGRALIDQLRSIAYVAANLAGKALANFENGSIALQSISMLAPHGRRRFL